MASPPSTSRAVIVSSSLDGTVRRWDLQKLIDSYYRSVLKCGCFTVDHSQGHRNGFGVNLPKHEYEKKPWAGALTIKYMKLEITSCYGRRVKVGI